MVVVAVWAAEVPWEEEDGEEEDGEEEEGFG